MNFPPKNDENPTQRSGATEPVKPVVAQEVKSWSLFSRYGHILMCLSENPDIRVSELATKLGVTERSARGLVDTLEKNEVVTTTRIGRNNRYAIDHSVQLSHPLESCVELQSFLDFTRTLRDRQRLGFSASS